MLWTKADGKVDGALGTELAFRLDDSALRAKPQARPWLGVLAALLLAGAPGLSAVAEDAEARDGVAAATTADTDESAADAADDEDKDVDVIVVTGSRLKRDTYDSISPLQIITASVKREAGLVDAAEILQEATTASGAQIDLTFQGLVLDDGPGAATANLRGLGASRTLLLINGRRIAPAGVEGAPSNPDLGIIPGLLVQQYDQLLDGASSVYGSDAVAGVINAILKKDFNGFTADIYTRYPKHGKGKDNVLGVTWGHNGERGFVGLGVEYADNEAVTLDDRPWTAGCQRHHEVDENGAIRNRDLYWPTRYKMRMDDDCTRGWRRRITRMYGPTNSTNVWLYNTQGTSNGGWQDYSVAWDNRFGIFADGDGDGWADVSYRDHSTNGRLQYIHLFIPRTTVKAMTYGEYTFEGEMNLTPQFELLHTRLDLDWDEGGYPIGVDVPARNPFNICNPEGEGVDCGLALDALWHREAYGKRIAALDSWRAWCEPRGITPENCTPAAFNIRNNAIGPIAVQTWVQVHDDRRFVFRESEVWRGVLGLNGDLPFLNRGPLADWSFNLSVTHSLSDGTSSRPGVRDDRLKLSLGHYSTSDTPCENNIDEATRKARNLDPLAADTAPGCVPVNLFAPSLQSVVIGDFATAAERDYLFDNRDFRTKYVQTIYTAFMSGTLFEMPAGSVQAGLGFDYRKDRIESIPDHVARDGLIHGFFSDGGATGDRYTQEAYAEIELPLVADRKAASELTVNLSGRWTDDEFYGGAPTGAVKLGWRPVDSLLIRATWGTSYRAPNLRELFLRGQTSFSQVFDPCFAPNQAFSASAGDVTSGELTYDPDGDEREPHVLERCRAHDVDPTKAYDNGTTTFSVEVSAGGATGLDEETSESMSFGFSWKQPFSNAFGLTIGMSYYHIEIDNTIIEPSTSYIMWDCYSSEISAGTFCDRIERDRTDPTNPRITLINRGFINRDNETVRGVDLNMAFDRTFTLFDRPFAVGLDVTGHRLIERTELYVNDQGERAFSSYHRTFGYAEHKAEFNLRVDYDDWRLAWNTRYLGNYEVGNVHDWSNVHHGYASTCLGPPTDANCKNVRTTDEYWLHHASVRYQYREHQISLGVRNVFDTPPPKVSPGEGRYLVHNVPRGVGFDLYGRTYFLSAKVTFGDGE